MSGLSGWKPLHPQHAIQVATIQLDFAQPITDVPWQRIERDGRVAARQANLTTEQKLQDIQIAIGPAGMPGPPDRLPGGGISFLRLRSPQFFEERFQLTRTDAVFETWAYTRWRAFSDRAVHLFGSVLGHYLLGVALQSITVQYVDRFDALNSASQAGEIVDPSSRLIVARAFQESETWHSHAGWFETVDARTKQLVNVDVDVADVLVQPKNSAQRVLQIRTSVKHSFDVAAGTAADAADPLAFIQERCEGLHTVLKDTLGLVLSRRAAAQISLGGRNE